MSLFHIHKWELVGKTYAAPVSIKITNGDSDSFSSYQQAITGTTTFLWECKDEDCDAIRKEVCLGKEERV